MTDFKGEVISSDTISKGHGIINDLSNGEDDAVNFTDDANFFHVINAKVNVARVGASKGRHDVTSNSLPHNWLITMEAARITVKHTNQ